MEVALWYLENLLSLNVSVININCHEKSDEAWRILEEF